MAAEAVREKFFNNPETKQDKQRKMPHPGPFSGERMGGFRLY